MHTLYERLSYPISNITLIIFRVAFGLVVFVEGVGAIATGWVKQVFLTADYSFTLIGFDFLRVLLTEWMYVHYSLIALSGILIAVGLYYRASVLIYLILWFVTYALQKHHYNNHYYLMILLGFLLFFVPANKRLSLDVKFGKTQSSYYCSAGYLYIFLLQLSIVYFYAAVAKMYPDWLMGKPLSIWFANKPILQHLADNSFFILLISYGGILFDLFIVPLLLMKPTRIAAVIISIIFHLFNSIVFQIGTFPYLMIGSLILFFPPEQIESRYNFKKHNASAVHTPIRLFTLIVFTIYFSFQLLLPLRHWLYPGDVNWTEEGHRLSWRMMLHSKSVWISFKVKDHASQKEWIIDPVDEGLTPKQKNVMGKTPDMIWQYAQYLKKRLSEKGFDSISIYCNSKVSLNGGPFKALVDPTVDLTSVTWEPFKTSPWVIRYDDIEDENSIPL